MTDTEHWTPPEHPDAHAILHEAVHDTMACHHEVALAKHIWFHENALRWDIGLAGVRRSFALAYWRDLADKYPPAMEKLVEAREKAKAEFTQSGFPFDAFHDLASLNRVLDERHKTAEAFIAVHKTDRQAAARIYHVAEPALIANRQFEICGDYLEPDKQLELAIKAYELLRESEQKWAHSEPRPPETARLHFMHEMTTLVSLLVKNGRTDEARQVASRAHGKLDDQEFGDQLDSALAGKLPTPWP